MSRRKIENSGKRAKNVEAFARAVEALKRGEVIVFPTETFYGLGADALDNAAVERVISLKGRDPRNPISIIVGDEKMLGEVVSEIPSSAGKLISRFWPGPLTLVLPARRALPEPLLNIEGKVGVRVSSHPLATRLTRELGHPLTATSANPSGKEPARTLDEARAYFAGRVRIFLEGGKLGGKKGSTVIEVVHKELRVIREGEIGLEVLEKALAGEDSW